MECTECTVTVPEYHVHVAGNGACRTVPRTALKNSVASEYAANACSGEEVNGAIREYEDI
jgi:hypothetical protein